MKCRKFKADYIFTGQQLLNDNHVLIADDTGLIIEIVDKTDAGENIETFKGLLTPGFINCHCHLELSHLKGWIPEKTGLVDFILKVVNERHFEEEKILQAIDAAANEMWQNGIVAVGDICNNTLTIAQKKQGRLRYHNFIEASGFSPTIAQSRFEKSKTILEDYHSVFNKTQSTINPHAPYSVSPEMFKLINDFPNNNLLTIHNQEIADEDEFFKNKEGQLLRLFEEMKIDISFFNPSGKSSLQTFLPYFDKDQSLILVHNVAASEKDIEFAKHKTQSTKLNIYYCLCPNANLYISNTLPNVDQFIKQQCDIVLGTDSLASNHQLSILEEMKTLQQNFPNLELTTLLKLATINGSMALQMDNELGSFEKGKTPGVVLIEGLNGLNLTKNSSSKRLI